MKLRDREQWVYWQLERRNGELTKVPYSPRTHRRASSTDPRTWGTLPEARESCGKAGGKGIGFVFTAEDPFCGVDLDGCLDPDTGEMESWAQEIVTEINSYTEISPSGTGVHVLVRATLPEGRNRKGRFEAYDRSRYFTVTGKHLAGTPRTVEGRQEELRGVLLRVFGEESNNGHAEAVAMTEPVENGLSDDEIISKAVAASNGERFSQLWTGDTEEYGSQSEADLALCGMLAFWTGGDAERIDTLFRQSGLYREKWDRADYRNRTITESLSGKAEFYRVPKTVKHAEGTEHKADGEAGDRDGAWEEPVQLPEGLPPVEELDPTMLPEPIRGWIVDAAERMQIAPDALAASVVVVLGSLVGCRLGMHPKRHDDWLVVPNLWGAVVGTPSSMKSPALAEAMNPLSRLVAEAYERHDEKLAAHAAESAAFEAMQVALKDKVKKAAKEAVNGDPSKLDEALEEQRNLEPPEEPTVRRYKTEDPTVEKLGELLAENKHGMLVHRDELSGFLKNLGKQGREGDRAFYLESWNGTGSFDVDRIGRGSLHVPALCLSILGGIQPGPLSAYVWQATQGTEGDDGLLQRFQLLVWPDASKEWRNVDRWPDAEAKNRAYEVFKKLDALHPNDFGATSDEEDGIPAVRFTPDAQEVFDQWRDELERELRNDKLVPALEAHLAKYRSLMPSLALLFQLVDFVDGTGDGGAVGMEATLRAVAWCEYLRTHAQRLYSSAQNPAMEGARALLARIRNGDVEDGHTVRDIYRKQWSKLSTPGSVQGAAEVLEDFGWLRVKKIGTRGRSTTQVHLHPSLKKTPDFSE